MPVFFSLATAKLCVYLKSFDLTQIRSKYFDRAVRQVPTNAAAVFDLLSSLPADFMADGRQDAPPQEREAF